jgi:hypothetical protein
MLGEQSRRRSVESPTRPPFTDGHADDVPNEHHAMRVGAGSNLPDPLAGATVDHVNAVQIVGPRPFSGRRDDDEGAADRDLRIFGDLPDLHPPELAP